MSQRRQIGSLPSGYPRMLPPEPTAIRTDATGLIAGAVWIPVHDGELPAYRAMPEFGDRHPVLLIVQEVFGVDEYLQDVCRRAARAGYLTIAPELYARQGRPAEATNREDLFKIVLAVSDAQVCADLDACAAWARDSGHGDPAHLAITGFCWGGRMVWLYAAHNPKLKAGVAWYGRLTGETDPNHPRNPIDVAGALHAPVLGLYGAEDQAIPLESVTQMKAKLVAAKSPSKFVIYDEAPHAFHADYRPSYQPGPATDGWKRMLDWLHQFGAA